MNSIWPRREWLAHTATRAAAVLMLSSQTRRPRIRIGSSALGNSRSYSPIDPGSLQDLARQALDAARAAGASYADARLTRTVAHGYSFSGDGDLRYDIEEVGIGVRTLVRGYWGFAASSIWTPTEAVRLARDAVTQATEQAKGPPRTVDLGSSPVVTGKWTTPIEIDPFIVSIEEKLDTIDYWKACAEDEGIAIDEYTSNLECARQERVLATSEGSLVIQTVFESGGFIECYGSDDSFVDPTRILVDGIQTAGKGWELFLEAKIPDQFQPMIGALEQRREERETGRPSTIGRHTVVCDGGTMASLVEQTLGIATQLDRALGYEANAAGTSFLDDPLAMVGQFRVASSPVTLTANRSAPAQLATVQWDDEGVVPVPVTLITAGILTDFQTTREQAAWLAPYYHQHSRPVRSAGYAAAEDAHFIPLQQMPNIALEPNAIPIHLEDLVADVAEGILIVQGSVSEMDFQAKTGLLGGAMRQITNGRVGRPLEGGMILFDASTLWKDVATVGGASTQVIRSVSQFAGPHLMGFSFDGVKGQPSQVTSHSVQAVAATIVNQALIDPRRKA